jgi:hypothetical protein
MKKRPLNMSNIYSRQIIRKTTATGSIPTIATHSWVPAWETTDLYDAELFINTTDNKIWIRSDDEIIELINMSSTGSIIGSTVSYTKFDTDGTMEAVGNATTWEDLRIEPSVRGTGANNPSFEKWLYYGSSRGCYLYSFDDANAGSEKEVFFTMQMPHAWAGTNLSIHVHWIGAVDDTNATPAWALEYSWADIGAVFPSTDTVYTDGINHTGGGTDSNVTAFKHYISEFDDITPTTSQDGISSILVGRLYRFSSDISDTYNATGAKCGLLYIDAHYEVNTLGSREEYMK